VNGTALAGSDYVAASGTVTFAPGETVKAVTVQVKGDRIRERTEAFLVRLSSPSAAVVATSTGCGGIVNDD
jgi:chitinase